MPPKRPAHYLWAGLIARIYEVFGKTPSQQLRCPKCGGQMRLIAFITEGTQIRRILDHIGVDSEPPHISPARGPPLWDDCDAQTVEGVASEPDWATDWDGAAQPAPDYEDGHQHVQQFAGIREALVAALVSRYGHTDQGGTGAQVKQNGAASDRQPLPYLRISRVPAGTADLKSRIIAAMGAGAIENIASNAGLTEAVGLLGIYNFAGSRSRYTQLMDGWLNAAPTGSIIMCHPALSPEPGDVICAVRAQEFAYWMSDDFPAAVARAGVGLVRGAAVLGLGGNRRALILRKGRQFSMNYGAILGNDAVTADLPFCIS